MAVVLNKLASLSHADCPADFYGESCKQRCNCTSPVNRHQCACESSSGQCDKLCMNGETVVDISQNARTVLVAVMVGGAATFILIGFSLFLWRREQVRTGFVCRVLNQRFHLIKDIFRH